MGAGAYVLFSVYFTYFFAMKPLVCLLKNLSHGSLGDRGLRFE